MKTPKEQCLRCDGKMSFIGTEKIQLGQTGLLLGMWSNILAGAMETEIYICSGCNKVEFYAAEVAGGNLPQKICPGCSGTHDFDYPKCPHCKYTF